MNAVIYPLEKVILGNIQNESLPPEGKVARKARRMR